MITKEDRIKMFANEIGYIADENLKKFAEKVLEDADDYFFTVPASSSGKYHPQFSLGESGLVRHTRVVAFFAKCIGESMMFNQHDIEFVFPDTNETLPYSDFLYLNDEYTVIVTVRGEIDND